MKILLVYPEHRETFWSFKYALKFISRKANFPPLGLLTIAAMLPKKWEKKLIDMRIEALTDIDIQRADYVFVSAMSIQKESVKRLILRCRELGVKIVAGGPLFTVGYEKFDGVNHFILNEAELTLPLFLKDLKEGHPKHIYTSNKWPDINTTPIPLWSLINMNNYASMCIQFSRGCPFNCEFCDVTLLFGHSIRVKNKDRVLEELESIYSIGWKGGVFIVDDNFIGNKVKIKREILPAMINWMEEKNHPFRFNIQASINISDDQELIKMMSKAGIDSVFVGIETPDDGSLAECGKVQNKGRDLISCVRKIQKVGLQVQAGFIVGFDNDKLSIFDRMIAFVQKSGIVTAMVGILNAPQGTKLYQRLKKENRLLKDISGDNMDVSTNFIPKMNYESLVNGYKRIIRTIYSPKYYYERILTLFKNFRAFRNNKSQMHLYHIKAVFKSIWFLGIIKEGRIYYWKLLFWTFFRRPQLVPLAITYSIYGFHFRKIFKDY